jgi:prevent-host-death family protein
VIEVTVAEAKARLSEIIKRVEEGEQVTITRRGKPVARMTASKPFLPFESHADLRAAQKPSQKTSAELIREMRDEGY